MFLPKGQFRRGYIQSWNVTLERELPGAIVGSVAYVGTHSVRQLADWDINAAAPGAGNAGRPLAQKFGRAVATNLLDGMIGANYQSLQTTFDRRFSGGLFLKGAYTFSHAITENDESGSDSGGTTLSWNHPSVRHRNRATAGYNRSHVFQMSWLYALPFGPGRKFASGGPASLLLRDWQVNGLLSSYNGTLFNVSASGTSLNAPGNTQTADQVKSKVEKLGGIGSTVSFFDPLAFRSVTEVRFGTTGRNILRGPGVVNVNLSVFRSFPMGERYKLEFRAEAFNATNTPHFGNPGTNVSNMQLSPDGSIRSLGGFTTISSAAADERQYRFALRLSF